MSSNLYWKPTREYSGHLPDALKFALRKKYDNPISEEFNGEDIDFLTGLHIGGIEGADKLIELIQKHGSIIVHEIH